MTKTKKCPKCNTTKEVTEFYGNTARYDGVAPHCKACHSADTGARQARWRDLALDALGAKCGVCGYDDRRALLFDHVEGGGGKHRLARGPMKFYRAIAEGSCVEGVQVLCWNCNHIKRIERSEHRTQRNI